MKFLIFWIQSLILSTGIRLMRELKLYHDLANAGYKVELEEASNMAKEIEPTHIEKHKLMSLIPIYNVIAETQMFFHYIKNKDSILYDLKKDETLSLLTKEEEEEYRKNPTPFHAFKMNVNHQVELEMANRIDFAQKENEISGSIYFDYGKEDEIRILKVTGNAKELSKEELMEHISCITELVEEEQEKKLVKKRF